MNIQTLSHDHLVLVGPQELLLRLGHLVIKEPVRVLLPLYELHKELGVLKPVPEGEPDIRLVRKAVPILLRDVAQHRHVRALLRVPIIVSAPPFTS